MLVLASSSPRRKQLLGLLGNSFVIRPASIPEVARRGERPEDFAVRLAKEKALGSALSLSPRERSSAILLAADTVVALGRRILGKPAGNADARRMLRLLSGRTHRVITGVAVWRGSNGELISGRRTTSVKFSRLTERQIKDYVATGEPMDVAGAYAIQGRGGVFIPHIAGSFSNVVGLPLDLTVELLSRVGVGKPASS